MVLLLLQSLPELVKLSGEKGGLVGLMLLGGTLPVIGDERVGDGELPTGAPELKPPAAGVTWKSKRDDRVGAAAG